MPEFDLTVCFQVSGGFTGALGFGEFGFVFDAIMGPFRGWRFVRGGKLENLVVEWDCLKKCISLACKWGRWVYVCGVSAIIVGACELPQL